jgi:hypothetical protein
MVLEHDGYYDARSRVFDFLEHHAQQSRPSALDRVLLEHAHAFEPIQDGRIYIEKLNGPFLFGDKGTPAEYSAGLELTVSRGWLELHESGTFVELTQCGAELWLRLVVFQN